MTKASNIISAAALLLAACSPEPANDFLTKANEQSNPSAKLQTAGWVIDDANVIDQEHEERITGKLRQLERETKHQMVVVTVRSLQGEDISPFTTAPANARGIGRKGNNDGVVLLVAPRERKVRIAVGRGLEKQLTDDLCRTIIEQQIIPRFRAGEMPDGIEAGIDALIRALKGERVTSGL